VDVFAFGTMLWELVWREVPNDGLDPADIRQKVESGEPLKINYDIDQRISQLINNCRLVDASARPNFVEIVDIINTVLSDTGGQGNARR